MTSQWVERTWIRTGGYGRFRGEWVNGQYKTQTADSCFHHANEQVTTIVPLFLNPKNNSPQSAFYKTLRCKLMLEAGNLK